MRGEKPMPDNIYEFKALGNHKNGKRAELKKAAAAGEGVEAFAMKGITAALAEDERQEMKKELVRLEGIVQQKIPAMRKSREEMSPEIIRRFEKSGMEDTIENAATGDLSLDSIMIALDDWDGSPAHINQALIAGARKYLELEENFRQAEAEAVDHAQKDLKLRRRKLVEDLTAKLQQEEVDKIKNELREKEEKTRQTVYGNAGPAAYDLKMEKRIQDETVAEFDKRVAGGLNFEKLAAEQIDAQSAALPDDFETLINNAVEYHMPLPLPEKDMAKMNKAERAQYKLDKRTEIKDKAVKILQEAAGVAVA